LLHDVGDLKKFAQSEKTCIFPLSPLVDHKLVSIYFANAAKIFSAYSARLEKNQQATPDGFRCR